MGTIKDRRNGFSAFDTFFGGSQPENPLTVEDAKAAGKRVIDIPIAELHPFKNHTFKVIHNKELDLMAESIREYGVIEAVIVRQAPEGGYEIISGHRRTEAASLAGLETIPVIVEDMDDTIATLWMIAANKKRNKFLPSELANTFKVGVEALKHRGKFSEGGDSAYKIGEDFGVSERKVKDYIRLTYLHEDLLDAVDDKKMQLGAAVEISFLTLEMQTIILEAYYENGKLPKRKQAKRIREKGTFNMSWLLEIGMAEDVPEKKITLSSKAFDYLPPELNKDEQEDLILSLLQEWSMRQSKSVEPQKEKHIWI